MKSEKITIKAESLFSDDGIHRYNLRKEWDKALPTATVISISPSSQFNVSADLTSMLITNNVVALGFGSFELLNLVCNYVKQLASIKKLMLFLAPLAGLIATFLAERAIASGLNVSASASMGYYLYLVISIP